MITEPNSRLDVRARDFWSNGQDAFLDVRVFYPNAPSNRSSTLQAAYKKHENSKRDSMVRGSVKSNMVCSHPSCSLSQEVWGMSATPFTRDWQTSLLRSRKKTLYRCHGLVNVSALVCDRSLSHSLHTWFSLLLLLSNVQHKH